jgi:hypothetical protein
VRLLVEEGGANPEIADRWGHTPLDEALRVGAGPVIRYFAGMGMAAGAGAAAEAATSSMLAAASAAAAAPATAPAAPASPLGLARPPTTVAESLPPRQKPSPAGGDRDGDTPGR